MATDTAETNGTDERRMNGLAIAARSEAVKRLIAKHEKDWSTILTEERVSRGLPKEAGGESTKELLARLEKAEAKAKAAREALALRGVEVEA